MITRKKKILLVVSTIALVAAIFWPQVFRLFVKGQLIFYKNYYRITGQQPKNYQSRIEVIKFSSPSLGGRQMEYRVYVPKAYDENPGQKFPVLYLLFGFPGSDQDWLVNANSQAKLDEMISNGKLKPLLVVFPDGNGPKITASQYVNATAVDQRMEDFIASDVVKDVDSRFRTINDRSARAIGGNSSGGYGAANVGLKHNDEFCVILVHGGFFDNWHNELGKVFNKDQTAIDANSPMKYLTNMKINPQTYIYLTIGKNDWGSMVEENKRFDGLLAQKNIPHELVLISATHNWNAWNKTFVPSLEYMNRYLRYE